MYAKDDYFYALYEENVTKDICALEYKVKDIKSRINMATMWKYRLYELCVRVRERETWNGYVAMRMRCDM